MLSPYQDLHNAMFHLKGVGRTSDDGEVSGFEVAKHPLSPRRHQEGEMEIGWKWNWWNVLMYICDKQASTTYYKGKKSRGLKGLQLDVGGRWSQYFSCYIIWWFYIDLIQWWQEILENYVL